jgi:hypothetical protein
MKAASAGRAPKPGRSIKGVDWAMVHIATMSVSESQELQMHVEMSDLCQAATDKAFLEAAFEKGIRQLEKLWAEVYFPMKQRMHFKKMFLHEANVASYTHLRAQISRLANYRTNLTRLISAVHDREKLLQAIHSRFDKFGSVDRSSMLQLCQLTYVVADRLKLWKKAYDFNDVFIFYGRNYEKKMALDAQSLADFVLDENQQ